MFTRRVRNNMIFKKYLYHSINYSCTKGTLQINILFNFKQIWFYRILQQNWRIKLRIFVFVKFHGQIWEIFSDPPLLTPLILCFFGGYFRQEVPTLEVQPHKEARKSKKIVAIYNLDLHVYIFFFIKLSINPCSIVLGTYFLSIVLISLLRTIFIFPANMI